MKKQLLTIFSILFLLTSVRAQSKLQIINNYSLHQSFRTEDFHDIQILNSGPTCRTLIEISIRSISAKIIVQRQNLELDILPGLNSLSHLNFNITSYSNEMSNALSVGNEIGYGRLEVCTSIRIKTEEIDLKECEEVNLNKSEMINLLMPGNGEIIETLNPDLEWISTFTGGVSYRVLLTEFAPYSTAEDAISSNLKLLNYTWKSMLLPYPVDAVPLRYNITYCWQVIAIDNTGQKVGQSEIWKFTPKTDVNEGDPGKGFTLIHRNINSGNYLYKNAIRFLYDNRTKDEKLNYSIVDLKTGKFVVKLPEINLVYGLNKITVNTSELDGLKKNGNYSFLIRNSFNEEYKMNFTITEKN